MSDTVSVRPLPAKPNLEFERKRAKHLLRAMRASDPTAKLADAQFAIAREYGFQSWPRLVAYFEMLNRHELSRQFVEAYPDEHYEGMAKQVVAAHHNRTPWAALFLAQFVPRFCGRSQAEVFSATVSIDDARLVVARQNRCASWEVLLERATARRARTGNAWELDNAPTMRAARAIKARDLAALAPIVDADPALLGTRAPDEPEHGGILQAALWNEWSERAPDARRVTDWLVARGGDLRTALGHMLIDVFPRSPRMADRVSDYVSFMLERGADPEWMPPNGISVLEHALLRYQDPDAVDMIARRVRPAKALWIAAGLGDVRATLRYFDHRAALIDSARTNRPDFLAVAGPMPNLTGVDDNDIVWEAFYVAAINRRTAVLDALLDHGLPVDYEGWGAPLLQFAVSRYMVWLVEYLLAHGANPNTPFGAPHATARVMAEQLLANLPANADCRRIYELCGGLDADGVLRRNADRYKRPAPFAPVLLEAIELAKDDAARLGQESVEPENLFVGLLRVKNGLPLSFMRAGGVDLSRLRKSIEHRLEPAGDAPSERNTPSGSAATHAMHVAAAEAERRLRHNVNTLHLLFAVVQDDAGTIPDLITAAGGSLARLREELGRAL